LRCDGSCLDYWIIIIIPPMLSIASDLFEAVTYQQLSLAMTFHTHQRSTDHSRRWSHATLLSSPNGIWAPALYWQWQSSSSSFTVSFVTVHNCTAWHYGHWYRVHAGLFWSYIWLGVRQAFLANSLILFSDFRYHPQNLSIWSAVCSDSHYSDRSSHPWCDNSISFFDCIHRLIDHSAQYDLQLDCRCFRCLLVYVHCNSGFPANLLCRLPPSRRRKLQRLSITSDSVLLDAVSSFCMCLLYISWNAVYFLAWFVVLARPNVKCRVCSHSMHFDLLTAICILHMHADFILLFFFSFPRAPLYYRCQRTSPQVCNVTNSLWCLPSLFIKYVSIIDHRCVAGARLRLCSRISWMRVWSLNVSSFSGVSKFTMSSNFAGISTWIHFNIDPTRRHSCLVDFEIPCAVDQRFRSIAHLYYATPGPSTEPPSYYDFFRGVFCWVLPHCDPTSPITIPGCWLVP